MTTDVRIHVVQAGRALAVAGHSDLVWGHVSIRDPDGRGVWMKATGWGFEEVTEERVLLVSPRGDVLDGDGRRHIEYPIHTQIMSARSDVNAVVHSHAAAAVTFASLDEPLRAISHDAVSFVGPDIPRFTQTGNLITDADLGDVLAESLGPAAGVLIPCHGLVTVGDTVAAAVMRAVLLERACSMQLAALQAGGPQRWSDDDEVRAKRDLVAAPEHLQASYKYLVRRAERLGVPSSAV